MKTNVTGLLLLLVLALVGCREAEPLKLPTADRIKSIEVLEGVLEQNRLKREVTSKDVINSALEFIQRNNKTWYQPWDTYPTPRTTVVFRNVQGSPELILWFGENWVGGAASPISPRKAYLWRLDSDKLNELKKLLGVGSSAGVRSESPPEMPLAVSAGDAELKWGPCPSLFLKGCEIAVLHGDPGKPNADVFLRIPPKYEISPHWRTSPERMVLVAGELKVEYSGYPPSVLKVGSYAYGPAKAPHKATCADAGPCVLFIAFESPVDALSVEGAKK